MTRWLREFWPLVLPLVLVTTVVPLVIWNFERVKNADQRACEARGGRFVITGRSMGNWICVDPKALR